MRRHHRGGHLEALALAAVLFGASTCTRIAAAEAGGGADARTHAAATGTADTGTGTGTAVGTKDRQVAPPVDDDKKGKELVVVSRSPELFTYLLTGISVLLSVIALMLGAASIVGASVVYKAARDLRALKSTARDFEHRAEARLGDALNALRMLSFQYATLQRVKHELADAMSMVPADSKAVYQGLSRTVPYPDGECLRLYAKALSLFEGNVDIVRVVRNGMLEYVKHPDAFASVDLLRKGRGSERGAVEKATA